MSAQERFKEIFWDAFHRPRLESEKFFTVWHKLEPLNDVLAGPLFSIYEKGECTYIFSDNHRFQHIKDADDLLNWLSEMIEHYREAVTKEPAETEEEKKDKQVLLFQTDMKMELADLAYQIILDRSSE